MNQMAAAFSSPHPNSLRTILRAGLLAGVMDITAAFLVYGYLGHPPLRLLQGIAWGLLGSAAYEGGLATALLGLVCHFVIAFSAAAVFVGASRYILFLVQHPIWSGTAYGVIVYFFMNLVVIPLSAIGKGPFSLKFMVIGIVIHIFCIGLPIAMVVLRYSKIAD
jgi:uncharacterized membrane protein YagU involved in acid resistance